jgi:hypothetical protein
MSAVAIRRSVRDKLAFAGRMLAEIGQFVGHPKLTEHLREMLALVREARNWTEFYEN